MRRNKHNPATDMIVTIEISDRAYKRCVEAAALAGVSLDDWLLAAGISGVRLNLNLHALCERAAQMCNMSVEAWIRFAVARVM